MLQSLQQAASTFAGMATVFSARYTCIKVIKVVKISFYSTVNTLLNYEKLNFNDKNLHILLIVYLILKVFFPPGWGGVAWSCCWGSSRTGWSSGCGGSWWSCVCWPAWTEPGRGYSTTEVAVADVNVDVVLVIASVVDVLVFGVVFVVVRR